MSADLTCLRPVRANGRKYVAGDIFDPAGLTDAQVARLIEVGAVREAEAQHEAQPAFATPDVSELTRLNADVADEPVPTEVRRAQLEAVAPAAPSAATGAPDGDDSQESDSEPVAVSEAPVVAPQAIRGRGRRR